MTGSALISARSLTRNYGTLKALDQVSFQICEGECVALVGPNGAGKSTLFKLCLGLLPATSGAITLLDSSPGTAPFNMVKRQIGFLPEQAMFQGSLTGQETLAFYARLKGADVSENDAILARVRLSDVAGRRVATYSKGMRQRLGLAQALIGSPKILLLDEPMSGLDPEARHNFFRILDEEQERGVAIVLSSHILTELEARTDRVAILSRGALKAIGPVAQLRDELNLHARIHLRASAPQMQRLAEHFAERFDPACFMNGAAILECGPDDKLALLQELMSSDLTFENLDILEPSLEQVFAAYTAAGEMS